MNTKIVTILAVSVAVIAAAVAAIVVSMNRADEAKAYAEAEAAQADAADDAKHVYCIVCRDICESNTIHPTRKYELSKRLADKICETQ